MIKNYFNFFIGTVAPHIESEGEITSINVIVNHDVTLECKVKGFPMPEIEWLKNGVNVNQLSKSLYDSNGKFKFSKSRD